MGKDYLGKDQRKTVDEEKDDKPIRGKIFRHLIHYLLNLKSEITGQCVNDKADNVEWDWEC